MVWLGLISLLSAEVSTWLRMASQNQRSWVSQSKAMRVSPRTPARTIRKYMLSFSTMVAKLMNYKFRSTSGHLYHHPGRIHLKPQQRKAKMWCPNVFYLRIWAQPCLKPDHPKYVPVVRVNQVSFVLKSVWVYFCHLQLKDTNKYHDLKKKNYSQKNLLIWR